MAIGSSVVDSMMKLFDDVISTKKAAPVAKAAKPLSQVGDVDFFQTSSPNTTSKLFKPQVPHVTVHPPSPAPPPQPTAKSAMPSFNPDYEQGTTWNAKTQKYELAKPAAKKIPIKDAGADLNFKSAGAVPLKKQQPYNPNVKPQPTQPGDPEGFTKIGQQAGSNPGGLYADQAGQKWYVKNLTSDQHAKNEMLANSLYRLAGADVPEMAANGAQVRSKIVDAPLFNKLSPEERTKGTAAAQRDFATDAWLANWDVAGTGDDNLIYDAKTDKAYRIDTGGALNFRAQGEPKKYAGLNFTSDAPEVDSLRDAKINKNTAAIFKGMTPEQLKASADRLAKITPQQIAQAVQQFGPADPIAQKNLTKLLIRRQQNVIQRLDPKETPGLTEEGKPERIKKLGKTMETFHGLGGSLEGKGLEMTSEGGFWSTPDKKLASMYGPGSQSIYDPKTKKGSLANFITQTEDYLVYDAKGKTYGGYDSDLGTDINTGVIKKAREGYYPGVVLHNVYDAPSGMHEGPPKTVVITLDPVTQRLKQAKFDPAKASLNDLLASGAAVAVPTAAWIASGDKAEAAESSKVTDETGRDREYQEINVKGVGPMRFPADMPREKIAQAINQYIQQKKVTPSAKQATSMLRGAESALPNLEPHDAPMSRFGQQLKEGFETAARGVEQVAGTPAAGEPGEIPGWAQQFAQMSDEEAKKPGEKRAYQVVAGIGNVVSGLGEAVSSVFAPAGTAISKIPIPTGTGETTHVPPDVGDMIASFGLPAALNKLNKFKGMASIAASPTPKLIEATSNDLFRLKQWVTADKAEVMQHLDTMPAEFKTAAAQEKFYHKLEDPQVQLTPEEQKVFDQFIEPMRKEIQKLSQVAGKYKYPLEDQEYVHRVVKGKEPKEGGTALPQEGKEVRPLGTHTLARMTSAMRAREMYVLERGDGARAVVSSPDTGKLTVWKNGKATTVPWGNELEPGNVVIVQGQPFTVKQAKTGEIEQHTPIRYYKSAAVNMGDALVKMRGVVRNIQYLDQLTKSAEWRLWATRGDKHIPDGWRQPDIPQLKDWHVNPKMADVLDDFYSAKIENKGLLDRLRSANRFAVASLFWNPVPHVENVAGHWFVARGFDWLKPSGYYSIFKDGAAAIKSVITLDDDYKDMLKHGSALISGGVQNADFYKKMAQKFGLEIQTNQSKWMQVANTLGLRIPDLIKAVYAGSNRVLWQANDIFMMQRVKELERAGMTRLQAIHEAEKHIPNYRVPTEIMGSRAFSKAMQDPAISAFGRYHYGVWNSYANMVKDLVGKGKTPEERFNAIGNMMALGFLTMAVYPAVSYGIQKLTGDEKIGKLARGPATIPTNLFKSMTTGEKQWYDVIGNSLTMAPATKELIEQISNRDLFTGRHIEEPGETSVVRRATQRLERLAQDTVAPYEQGRQMAAQMQEKGVPRALLDQAIGLDDKTAAQTKGRLKGQKMDRAAAKARRRRPRGLIEEYGGALE